MVGSVLHQEMLMGTRRSRWHWFRWIYAGWIVLLVFFGWLFYLGRVAIQVRYADYMDFAEFSRGMVDFLTWQHFLLLTLTTPIIVEGAITDEKSRGTLQYLLTADLFTWEILIGKLVGRVYQVVMLALIGLPMICFLGVFAGIDHLTFLSLIGCSLLMFFSLGSISLLASVWCRHTRDAVLTLYCILGAMYLILVILPGYFGTWSIIPTWLTQFLLHINPLEPLGDDWLAVTWSERQQRLSDFTLVWGSLGLFCLIASVFCLRWKYIRQLEKTGQAKKKRWWTLSRPRLGNSPLTWKERYVEGVAPLALLRQMPTWTGILCVFLLTTVACCVILLLRLPVSSSPQQVGQMLLAGDWAGLKHVHSGLLDCGQAFYTQGWVVMLLTGLIIGVRCSGAVTGEREKRTWEALLLTPLETTQLIRGKLWGIAGASVPYLTAYATPALLLSLVGGLNAFFWTLLWIGVIILAIFYVGAAGLWCSVRSKSSWRSLLSTLAFTYLGGFVLACVISIAASIVAMFVMLFLMMLDGMLRTVFGITSNTGAAAWASFAQYGTAWNISICLVSAGAFALLSWMLLRSAEYRVGLLERIKHWKNEPRRPIRRRRPPPDYYWDY